MGIYAEFARVYAQGPYRRYSADMAGLLPAALDRFAAQPQTVLDLACGEGTFALAMARQGFQVTGVDQSAQMLELAREQAAREGLNVEFALQDMRTLPFADRFDLVTCWYDSLNYLLQVADLERTFAGVHQAVRADGLFVFDMNTLYGLAVHWQRQACYVQQDTPALLEIHRTGYDYERDIATVHITAFVREGDTWRRLDEEHSERGYPLEEIRRCFRAAGWQELACWGSLREMSALQPDSGRVWFVLRKPGGSPDG
jgi:SAM-dependent methyltransferase